VLSLSSLIDVSADINCPSVDLAWVSGQALVGVHDGLGPVFPARQKHCHHATRIRMVAIPSRGDPRAAQKAHGRSVAKTKERVGVMTILESSMDIPYSYYAG
jgi:hypothetical protein